MQIVIPKETLPGETRVAASPDTVKKLCQQGHQVLVEHNAGLAATWSDQLYIDAGAAIATDTTQLYSSAALILKVNQPNTQEIDLFKPKSALVAQMNIHRFASLPALAAKEIDTYALELIPRITRGQSMDILSSQANIAGYRAVLLATHYFPRFMPMFMTAAGSVKPARVLILGAGVAGLQAIATAKRLGAIVEVFDVRPATREQVESLGAKFIEVELNDEERAAFEHTGGYAKEMSDDYKARQSALIAQQAAAADIIISTALIPGKPAPVLITPETVAAMKPGSVIIDLAVAAGGNCPLSRSDEVVKSANGVTIVGQANLPALVATDASSMFARNVLTFLGLVLNKEGQYAPQLDDEIIKATLVTHAGSIYFGSEAAPKAAAPAKPVVETVVAAAAITETV
ncbi:Re/Si-specific NAD(P)(+) transhydrogenase subunit alpha [Chitinibacter bivalviorum]|uniref:NAD(P) transhydrogenase subunit alpha part 1 n=1 Tax=Chitinibacter bivalviorum TaxID=2739434 RepID=A0A7H9BIS4_9NEIS|nr:Re/Si-specific NAD(P)(+) transhydrogenase subunit alpha [Chitinibacter bivalviorum]QLG88272.1 Re/Si-specific NAD(P)(+) transhydrogenase subunit alpha [Chitinibacter bivalviorum]